MEPIRPTHRLVKRLVPVVAMWGIGKLLESRPVRKRLDYVDQRFFEKRRAAMQKTKRTAKRAVSNNAAWLAAGAAAFIAGIGMMAKAAKR